MSDNNLTPRVGDRVLVRDGGKLRAVDVVAILGHYVDVRFDDGLEVRGYRLDLLTFLDRTPVEWPDGWDRGHTASDQVAFLDDDKSRLWFTRHELERFLSTGPDMLARWDELVGGDA